MRESNFHLAVALLCALIFGGCSTREDAKVEKPEKTEELTLEDEQTPREEAIEELTPEEEMEEVTLEEEVSVTETVTEFEAEEPVPVELTDLEDDLAVEMADLGELAPSFSSLIPPTRETLVTFGYSGRSLDKRKDMLRREGGDKRTEAAIGRALNWFVRHQNSDGSWSFDHRNNECIGECRRAGSLGDDARLGATGLVLLTFLAAGHTHQEGPYKSEIHSAFNFLLKHSKRKNGLHTWIDRGNMYSHAIVTRAVCEVYGMTNGEGIEQMALQGLMHIQEAQDPVGGGWRYEWQQSGDTSVTGWQLMALIAGYTSNLQARPETIQKAIRFLNKVESADGAKYGYQDTRPTDNMTAIGLLCRMHLGWKRDNPAIVQGVKYLGQIGSSDKDMYFNYHATQVMFHYGGKPWKAWNSKMKEILLKAETTEGHAAGSWHFGSKGQGEPQGGRLYSTALAVLTLQVYYRMPPIFKEPGEFPL